MRWEASEVSGENSSREEGEIFKTIVLGGFAAEGAVLGLERVIKRVERKQGKGRRGMLRTNWDLLLGFCYYGLW